LFSRKRKAQVIRLHIRINTTLLVTSRYYTHTVTTSIRLLFVGYVFVLEKQPKVLFRCFTQVPRSGSRRFGCLPQDRVQLIQWCIYLAVKKPIGRIVFFSSTGKSKNAVFRFVEELFLLKPPRTWNLPQKQANWSNGAVFLGFSFFFVPNKPMSLTAFFHQLTE
jgi:hypothetical protein